MENWSGRHLLNPYTPAGTLIDLNLYPKAKAYLESCRPVLENRHIVKNNRPWYSLIDKVKHGLTTRSKILLPDISANRMIFVDKGRFYPAHNIYYVTGAPIEELKILAAMLMSDFTRRQINGISNKMNGGMARWQSQAINRLKLPPIHGICHEMKQELIAAYDRQDIESINSTTHKIISMARKCRPQPQGQPFPKSLFDYDFSQTQAHIR